MVTQACYTNGCLLIKLTVITTPHTRTIVFLRQKNVDRENIMVIQGRKYVRGLRI